MKYNFDTIIDRNNTNSLKYDFATNKGKAKDILPLWVADMDFKAPPEVINTLVKKSHHGIFGYSEAGLDYFNILSDWFKSYYDWHIKSEWLVKTPGVVFAISTVIRALTHVGDAVIIQEPVYYPFKESILINKRKCVVNQLVYTNGKYSIDFDDFEDKIIRYQVKLFILCNPHNPVGRVWSKEELIQLGDICVKHGIMVISDEIHADFTYHGYKHHVFQALKPSFSQLTITCTAPTKTFNLAGLQISNIFISNPELRHAFKEELNSSGYSQLNIMGIVACKTAYKNCHQWLEELKIYLKDNLEFVKAYLNKHLPILKLVEPQGTYLVWIDFMDLGFNDDKLEDLIVNKAGLLLDSGTMFGSGGQGFQRINIACPRSVLKQALKQLNYAINNA